MVFHFLSFFISKTLSTICCTSVWWSDQWPNSTDYLIFSSQLSVFINFFNFRIPFLSSTNQKLSFFMYLLNVKFDCLICILSLFRSLNVLKSTISYFLFIDPPKIPKPDFSLVWFSPLQPLLILLLWML